MMKPCFLLIAAVFLSAGCSAVRGIEPPTVEVVEARVVEQSPRGASLAVTLRVVNPNTEELPMPRVTCDLDVVGGGRFTFTDVPYATVPGNGERFITIPAGLTGGALAGQRYTVRGTVVFAPEGQLRRVLAETGFPLPRSDFEHEGTVVGGPGTDTPPAE